MIIRSTILIYNKYVKQHMVNSTIYRNYVLDLQFVRWEYKTKGFKSLYVSVTRVTLPRTSIWRLTKRNKHRKQRFHLPSLRDTTFERRNSKNFRLGFMEQASWLSTSMTKQFENGFAIFRTSISRWPFNSDVVARLLPNRPLSLSLI